MRQLVYDVLDIVSEAAGRISASNSFSADGMCRCLLSNDTTNSITSSGSGSGRGHVGWVVVLSVVLLVVTIIVVTS